MLLSYNRELKERAREMRKNPTEAEALLWKFLRKKNLDGEQWYRQKTIGNFIVDFHCPQRKLVVEADGSQHFSEEGRDHDAGRSGLFEELGLKVLRFENREILKNVEEVAEKIKSA